MAIACPIDLDTLKLRTEIQSIYARVAADPSGEFHFHRGPEYAATRLNYDAAELSRLPRTVTESFAGVGNPHSIAPLPAAAHGFSAGWAVPEGRGPTGAERWIPSTRNGRCRGRRRKKFTESAVASSRHGWTNFIRPLDTGRAVCYFRPASGIDRSASWCRFPRRGARSRGRSSSVRR